MKELFGKGNGDSRSEAGGAVMVEFLIAYLPVLISFLAFWQLGELLVAQMVVERASSAAGRAAVVVLGDDPAFYAGQTQNEYEGERKREIRLAAGMMLSASPHLSENFTLAIDDVPQSNETAAEITVKLDAEFRCKRLTFVCGVDGLTVLSANSQHTYHGANYTYEPSDLGTTGQSLSSSEPGCTDGETGDGKGGKGSGGKGSGGKGSGGNSSGGN